jgi:hypothetical protein
MWHEFESFSTVKMAEAKSKREALENQVQQKITA